MKVNELIQELQKCPKDLEVFTKKTEIIGTIGAAYHVHEDMYSFLGADLPCVIISDAEE